MIDSELSLRLARASDAAAIANLSRELIEYGLLWRWTSNGSPRALAPTTPTSSSLASTIVFGFGIMSYGVHVAH